MDNTTHTATTLRQQAAAKREQAAESFERCDTDGFLSQWASDITARKLDAQADIAENGGKAYFARYILLDAETGETVDAKLIETRFGTAWLIPGVQGKGRFVNAHPKREATMVAKGYREAIEVFEAEARADIAGSGTGLSGAASCHVVTRPADRTVRFDMSLGPVDREAAEAHFAQADCTGSGRLFPKWVAVRFI
jgi:hypothetical protein